MDSNHLKLKHFVIANFKSLKRIELDRLHNLVLFMGRNNAGKSNILDAFKFLADAAQSFEHAFSSRGGDLTEIVHRKKEDGRLEFSFDFILPQEKRAELVGRLFSENKLLSAAAALGSDLLSVLTLRISVGRFQFTEELQTTNFRAGGPPASLFSIKGTPQKTEVVCGQLESLCRRCSGELPAEGMALESAHKPAGEFRLFLGRPEAGAAFPISFELAEMVHQQFASLEWIDPLRKLPTSSPIHGQITLAPDASNLPDVLHWLYNNKPKQFRKIEVEVAKLVPQLGRLYTPTIQNAATLGLIDNRDEDLVFSMNQMSFGTRSVVAIVAKVVLAQPGGWVCIEEPETYLHPKAQLGLFSFLREEAKTKRLFAETHSTSIAASCPLESLFIVQRDAENCTAAVPVTEVEVYEVIEQLGVKPSFSFEAEAIVFVEDDDDVLVYEAWAKKFGFNIKIQFLGIEGASTLHYFANTRIALSKFVHTLVFAVFRADSPDEQRRATRDKVLKQLELPAEQLITLEVPELAGYLLEAPALLKAFHSITLSEADLESRLAAARQQPNQKQALRDLLIEFKIGEYEDRLGARIAEAMETIPASVAELFEKIDASSKPFWKI